MGNSPARGLHLQVIHHLETDFSMYLSALFVAKNSLQIIPLDITLSLNGHSKRASRRSRRRLLISRARQDDVEGYKGAQGRLAQRAQVG